MSSEVDTARAELRSGELHSFSEWPPVDIERGRPGVYHIAAGINLPISECAPQAAWLLSENPASSVKSFRKAQQSRAADDAAMKFSTYTSAIDSAWGF